MDRGLICPLFYGLAMRLLTFASVPFVVVAVLYSSAVCIRIVSSHDEQQIDNADFVDVAVTGLWPNRPSVYAGQSSADLRT